MLNGIDGLVQDCSNSSALAMDLLQSNTKPAIFNLSETATYMWTGGTVFSIW